ncbi:ATP-dependent RNA helicase [Wickerhamomyces ciferrii]|uniref:RNA helicase n=1 Tax=Wickerhamomyces ciferrii (strain ATCC 14091 / BCRC 22168 / CBS 111 / JCM 3599 / NBRC 0793 / NRRL Y-1031 F-60-10) TaxID=1206466 RepID=K0KZ82_WICCF|nr:ATP-dependent RNA helicase [Wickerhamomyces ciferrii]CCH46674.1 ATP-dependent RNA helicase [Wickerhamomyces ciferrii]
MAGRGPISLEELIEKKKNEGRLDTPKFLSKKERQQIALEKRQNKVDQLQQTSRPSSNSNSNSNSHDIRKDTNNNNNFEDEFSKNYQKELERAKSSRKKFKFDWKEDEDTFNNENSLISMYSNPIITKRKPDDLELISTRKKTKQNWDDIHWTAKPLEQMKSRDWRILKEDYEIIIKGSNLPNPLRNWRESKIPLELLDIIHKLGYKEPTPIQRASIPISLSKKDIIGIAETGSGKTLAYLIPMLSKLLKLPRLNEFSKADGPYGLILVPTRELAQQIEIEFKKFSKFLPSIDIISLVGGKLIEKNILDLQNKTIEIIIATPGRLIDCLERHILVLNQIQFLVLDESDKMIEMNFGDQVAKITEFMNLKRQNMMFTATMTLEVEKLSKNYVNDPAIINIGNVNSNEMIINDRIEQKFEFFNNSNNINEIDSKKISKLIKILSGNKYKSPIIIFINYKETGDFIFKKLSDQGFKVSIIHGSKNQEQREFAIKQLKDGKVDILIGTNVASRGIDIPNVSLVLNFQMTKKIDDYIHRVGRTGRAGSYGTSITFLNDESDFEIYNDLKKILIKSGNKIPDEFKKLNNNMKSIV